MVKEDFFSPQIYILVLFRREEWQFPSLPVQLVWDIVVQAGFTVTKVGFIVTKVGFIVTHLGFSVTKARFMVTKVGFIVTHVGFAMTKVDLQSLR